MKISLFIIYLLCSTVSYSQQLIIGSSKYNPPFETWVTKNNQYYGYGYDIDLMTEICRRLDEQCKFQSYTFDQLFDALRTRQVDMVIASIIITEDRKKEFLFTLPYLGSNAQFIANESSLINTIADVNNKKIGVRSGTPYVKLARRTTENTTIIFYNTTADMFIGLQNNEVDVCVMDYEAAKSWLATNPGIYKFIGNKIPIGLGYAIMLNKGQDELVDKINRIILEMGADGTFLRIYAQYF